MTKRYEYKQVSFPNEPGMLEKTLNEYGAQGWRVVRLDFQLSLGFTLLEREISA